MHRLRIFGGVIVFTLAFASASASASEPEYVLLSGENFPAKFEGTSGKGLIETVKGTDIKCSSGTSKGEITGAKAGTASITFTGCESSGFKCATTGAATGEITISGSTTLVFDSLGEPRAALLLSLTETTIECTALVKIKIKSNILLLLSPLDFETTKFEATLKQTSGKPADNKYWNSAGEEKAPLLLAAINGGTFEEAAEESAEIKLTTNKPLKIEVEPGLQPAMRAFEVTTTEKGASVDTTVIWTNLNNQAIEVDITAEPLVGGEESWTLSAPQLANVCKSGMKLKRTESCTVKATFNPKEKPKGGTYLGQMSVGADMGGGLVTLKGNIK
jgi:hypothetical protein